MKLFETVSLLSKQFKIKEASASFLFWYGRWTRTNLNARLRWSLACHRLDGDDTVIISRPGIPTGEKAPLSGCSDCQNNPPILCHREIARRAVLSARCGASARNDRVFMNCRILYCFFAVMNSLHNPAAANVFCSGKDRLPGGAGRQGDIQSCGAG